MSVESDVMDDLKGIGMDKAKLMQKYSDKQKEILKMHGGSISDIPVNPDHEYHDIQRKLAVLNNLK